MLTSSVWTTPHPRLNMIRCVWVAMMLLADRRGYVHSSVPGLAAAAVVSVEDVEEALELFRSPDPYSRTKEQGGRRIVDVHGGWLLLNYAGHHKAALAEITKNNKREWYYRKKAAQLAEVSAKIKLLEADTSTDTAAPAEAVPEFRKSVLVASVLESEVSNDVQGKSKLDPSPRPPPFPPSYSPLSLPLPPPSSVLSPPGVDRSLAGPDQSGSSESTGHVELQGQRVVYRSLEGWLPKPEHFARAAELGVSRDVFDERLADLRGGPVGGARGVYDLDDYVLRQIAKWRTWGETANYSAVHPPGSTNGARGGPGRGGGARSILGAASKQGNAGLTGFESLGKGGKP